MSKKENAKTEVFEGAISKIEKSDNVNTIADKYLKEIIYTKQSIGLRFLYLGQLLYNVKEKEIYKQHADTYSEYIAMPEINMKLSTADNLKRVYKQFVVEWGIEPELLGQIGHSKLVALLERTNINSENAEEWLHKALTLSYRDIMIVSGKSDDFSGVISADIFSDDDGLLIEIKNAPNNIPRGLYRLTKGGAKGNVIQLGYLKGRKTS